MHLRAGSAGAAIDSLGQSVIYCEMFDNNLDREYQLPCAALGLTPERDTGIQSLEKSYGEA